TLPRRRMKSIPELVRYACGEYTRNSSSFRDKDCMSSLPVSARKQSRRDEIAARRTDTQTPAATSPNSVLIVAPALDTGAADTGATELARILTGAGYRAIVVSRVGRLVADLTAVGVEFIPLDVSSNNPVTILRNALRLT